MSIPSAVFRCLYLFGNPAHALVEIKRLNVAEDAPAEQRYQWLWIDNANGAITPLTFIAMQRAEREFREFRQGTLTFDARSACFRETGSETTHTLQNWGNEPDAALQQRLATYLNNED